MKRIMYLTLLSLAHLGTINGMEPNSPAMEQSDFFNDFPNLLQEQMPQTELLDFSELLESKEAQEALAIPAAAQNVLPQEDTRKRKPQEPEQPKKEQHKKYTCGFPGCTFKGRNSVLKHHILAMHISYKPYKCPGKNEDGTTCALATSQKSNLRAHIRACHKDQPDLQVPELSMDEKAQIETLVASYMPDDIAQHGKESLPFKCRFFGCSYESHHEAVQKHILAKHTTHRPYKCPGKNKDNTPCPHADSQRTNLKRHMLNKHKDQPDLQIPELSMDEKAQIKALTIPYMSRSRSLPIVSNAGPQKDLN